MLSIQTTEIFDEWFGDLKDRGAKLKIQVRIDRAEGATWVITNLWVMECRKCESTMAQATAFTSQSGA
jgi:hypothetical protein